MCDTAQVSPIDPSTLGSDTPRTLDGREYPEHLRAYHRYDGALLPVVESLAPATFDDLSLAIEDARIRAALPRWLASAEWRGLIQRGDGAVDSPRRYVLGPAAHQYQSSAA
jgi:hypothetical protein